MSFISRTILTVIILSGTNSFAGREAGGGDPNVDEFVNNLETVCSFMPENSSLKPYTEACVAELKSIKESLNLPSKKARIFSTLEPVFDKNGVPKVLVTNPNEANHESSVTISSPAWNSLSYEQKVVATYMEVKLLLAIPVERYGGEELKKFKNSALFLNYVTQLNKRKEQIYGVADKDLEACRFVYLEKQGALVPVVRRDDGDRYLSRPGYRCRAENGHILEMVSLKQKPEGFNTKTDVPGISYYPDQVNGRGHWIIWKDVTAKKYYSEIMSIGVNVSEMFYRNKDICTLPLTKNFRSTDTLPLVKWRSIKSDEMLEANKGGLLTNILMGHNAMIHTGETVPDERLRDKERAYISVKASNPLEKQKMIRLGDKGSEDGVWDESYDISSVLCVGEDLY